MSFNLIVALDEKSQIGIKTETGSDLLYPIPHDLRFFSSITTGNGGEGSQNVVVMGHNTWKSLPSKFKPLPNRHNIVLSRNPDSVQGTVHGVSSSLTETLDSLELQQQQHQIGEVFIIGGADVYQQVLSDPRLRKVFITHIYSTDNGDNCLDLTKSATFTTLDIDYNQLSLEWSSDYYQYTLERGAFKGRQVRYQFKVYQNMVSIKNHLEDWTRLSQKNVGDSTLVSPVNNEEVEYLGLLQRVVKEGDVRTSRNGSTRSIFGVRMEFDLTQGRIPLLTTKKMAWKTVIKELLWFLSGDTNAKTLQDQKVRIWDGNSSREYLDSIGLTDREVGDLGPVYGFQWRHFGAKYQTCHSDYSGQGVDQIKECLRQIKESPTSRRILFTGWNPLALKEMALPPCHLLCQFFVESDDRLSLQLYQRSGDSFLGIPFNIFSYSVLLLMFCRLTDKKPGRMIHVIGDFHVYENHLDAVKTQLERIPYCFPRIEVEHRDNLEDFSMSDFKLMEYHCHGGIKAPMAA